MGFVFGHLPALVVTGALTAMVLLLWVVVPIVADRARHPRRAGTP